MIKRLLFIFLIIIFSTSLALSNGHVTFTMGKVEVKNDKSNKWTSVKINTELLSTDTLRVDKKSKAVIKFSNGRIYTIDSVKMIKIADIETQISQKTKSSKSLSQLLKEKGIKIVKSDNLSSGPSAVAGVRGDEADSSKGRLKPEDVTWKE